MRAAFRFLALLVTCVWLSSSTLPAQGSWTWQNPLPQGNELSGVFFLNDLVGWAAGKNGTILKTTDGGAEWTLHPSGTREDLYGIQFLTESVGYAIGRASILKSTDGGETWVEQSNGTMDGWLQSVFAVDGRSAWVVGDGGSIFSTVQAGAPVSSEPEGLPQHPALLLHPNYPNPFRDATVIGYTLPDGGPVQIRICNLAGQEVARPLDAVQRAGEHVFLWDGRDDRGRVLPSGAYLVRLIGEATSATRLMTLIR